MKNQRNQFECGLREIKITNYIYTEINLQIDSDLFPSVKWEDKEPTRVTVRLA